MESRSVAMDFKLVVEQTSDIKDGYCSGLQALGHNADLVSVVEPRNLEGSVDIDLCTKSLYPEEARWDYAVAYDSKVYYIEIHPANTSDVNQVIKKADWLRQWLKNKAPLLLSLPSNKNLYWVPTGKYNILPASSHSRRLAQKGVQIVSRCKLPL